jgi:hypothetical protein
MSAARSVAMRPLASPYPFRRFPIGSSVRHYLKITTNICSEFASILLKIHYFEVINEQAAFD